MSDNLDLNQNEQLIAIISSEFQPVRVDSSNQLLSALKKNKDMGLISQIINFICDDSYIDTDSDYLELKINQKLLQQDRNGIKQSIRILEQKIFEIECLDEELQRKRLWIQQKTRNLQQKKALIQEDCEVLEYQNANLGTKINQQGLNSESNTKQIELKKLLQKYRCQEGFPKNKLGVMQLISRLDVQIQKLEIQKISL